ncbi:Rhodanese-related sulfurtransferase [Klebsiella pneumoniae]|uniref:Rhodanese-related sulfurtransferase n=1 Tax=Klebsiella pneumoniae TaxID=573 RepID=A0A3S4GGC5_KLEPN|nr:Rhodanese-related sulfurtransferase [Klebsiella pneumoniae]
MQEIMQFIGRHPVLSIAWIALLGAVVFTTFKGLMSKVKVITRGEATRLINKEDAVGGPTCVSVTISVKAILPALLTCCPAISKPITSGELEKHKSQPIIVVDGSGMQAQEPASALNKAGFEKVFVLERGHCWLERRKPPSGTRQITYLAW